MPTARHSHFEYDETPGGFPPGETRVKRISFPNADLTTAAISVTATPFYVSNQTRRLRVADVVIRAHDPSPPLDAPQAVITVESLGPDTPQLWYLNIAIIEP